MIYISVPNRDRFIALLKDTFPPETIDIMIVTNIFRISATYTNNEPNQVKTLIVG